MNTFLVDVRFSLRMMARNPGFTLIVILTLTLGIGANTSIFSVVDSVLLRPLPYPESDRLVWLSERSKNYPVMSLSYPDYLDWREQQTVFEKIGVYNFCDFNLTGSGDPARLSGGQMSADAFAALKVSPILGRYFSNDEDRPGASPVAVLSYDLWKNRFLGDSNIINKSITLDGRAFAVIGIMPEGFAFPSRVDVWTPIGLRADAPDYRMRANHPGLFAVARLKQDVSLERALEVMDAIAVRLEQQYFDSNENIRVDMIPLLEYRIGNSRLLWWTLLGAVGIVLLIGCVNVANLLLARSIARQKEMAVRAALGAGRWRIVRQLLTESVMLALVSGTVGWLFAEWGLDLILALGGDTIPRIEEIRLDGRVLFFTAAVALFSGILFGIAPAWRSSRTDIEASLKNLSRGVVGGRSKLRNGLVVAEVALTFLLLVGAGLMVRSFYNLQTLDPGYDRDRILSFRLDLPEQKYKDEKQYLSFYETLAEKVRNVPGIRNVAYASQMPLSYTGWTTSYQIDGQPLPESTESLNMEITAVSSDYFRTLGIPLLKGRYFTERDNLDHLRSSNTGGMSDIQRMAAGFNVIIVDDLFAKQHWPNEDPIGKQVRLIWGKYMGEGGRDPILTVVGVVPRVRLRDLNDRDGFVQAYFSVYQYPPKYGRTVLMKTTLPSESLIATVRKQVTDLDPEQPIFDLKTMDELRDRSLEPQRVNLILFSIFGLSALALALIGLYGVLAYSVSQQRNEIGIRMALGAQREEMMWLILRHGLSLTGIGIVTGLIAAMTLTRVIRSMLYGIAPTDSITFICVALLLFVVAWLACYIPARRAAKIDPMTALRCE